VSRIAGRFKQLAAQGKTALIPYIVAGDPEPGLTVSLMHQLVASGADVLEVGVPFSDPMSEGPVIQLAHERALEHNVTLFDVLDMVSTFREKDETTPVLLMGYANPVEYMGYERFADAASAAGVDALLTVDIPPEEVAIVNKALHRVGMDNILLIAPTTPQERITRIVESASGFIYYVSLKGVTGAGHLDTQAVSDRLGMIRKVSNLPVAVGFGIKDATSAAAVAAVADGVVVGSALVDAVANAVQAAGEKAERGEVALRAAATLMDEIRGGIESATS